MTTILQDCRDFLEARKNVAVTKTLLRDEGDIVSSVCKVYPCFDNGNTKEYTSYDGDTKEYTKDVTFYKTFCKDCKKFDILLQLYNAQQKQQAMQQKLFNDLWNHR